MNHHNDLLYELYRQYADSAYKIDAVVIGAKYCAVTLCNGNTGVCATLGNKVDGGADVLQAPDFSQIAHRILVGAFINSCCNYSCQVDNENDIFDAIDFSSAKSITMVGFFAPLVEKFRSIGIALSIFDLNSTKQPTVPLGQQKSVIQQADTIILTATSISNKTFNELISFASPRSKVYILGPSTPLHDRLFGYPQVKGLFGSLFGSHDHRVHQVIKEGGGTRNFAKYMRKVYRLKK